MHRASIAVAVMILLAGAFILVPAAGCTRGRRRADPLPADAEEGLLHEEGEEVLPVQQEEAAPERRSAVRITLDGHEMEPVRDSPLWLVRQPVSLDPVFRFESDLPDFRRAFIFISPSNERGELTGEAPVTIIDPKRATLVPGAEISLRSPKECVITRDGDLASVPIAPGRHYRLELHAEGASGAESVAVLFRTAGGEESPPAPFRGLLR